MKIDFKIIAYASDNWKNAVALREEILRKPFGLIFTEEELEEEKNYIQVIGKLNRKIIATAVLVPENTLLKMQRVVVAPQLQNYNIGSAMMSYCETYALDKNYHSIYCHARDTAVDFYLKNGYLSEGDYFDEDGIPHLKMRKILID